MTHSIRG